MLNRWIEADLLDDARRARRRLHRLLAARAGHADGQVPGRDPGGRAGKPRRLAVARLLNDETLARIRALNEIAARRGQSLAQLALAWALRDPRVTSALIGASSVGQLENERRRARAARVHRRRARGDRQVRRRRRHQPLGGVKRRDPTPKRAPRRQAGTPPPPARRRSRAGVQRRLQRGGGGAAPNPTGLGVSWALGQRPRTSSWRGGSGRRRSDDGCSCCCGSAGGRWRDRGGAPEGFARFGGVRSGCWPGRCTGGGVIGPALSTSTRLSEDGRSSLMISHSTLRPATWSRTRRGTPRGAAVFIMTPCTFPISCIAPSGNRRRRRGTSR